MNLLLSRIATNWRSGLTVALVSIPLSVSLSLAAGATPQMGIITAIWAGLFAAILGGSNYNVVGPTGALSGILATYALLHGVQSLPFLAICSGILIVFVFLLRLEKYIVLIPASVLHGFTLGVAFVIGLGQVNAALGIVPLIKHETLIANLFESIKLFPTINSTAAFITLAGVIFLFSITKKLPKVPSVIVLSIIGIIVGLVTSHHLIPLTLATIQSRYGTIPSSIIIFPPQLEHFVFNKELITASITVAIVAILETLLSGKIADGMTKTRFNPRKEMIGLGVANIASGVFGGIPATAALARTSLNIKTGANDKTSSLISSISIAVISIIFLPYFQYLPLSIVAAILIFVAINMVKREHFVNLYKFDKRSFFLSLLVAVLTVGIEPLTAIGVGTVIALLLFINELSQANGEVNVNSSGHELITRTHVSQLDTLDTEGTTIVYRFAGELIYINAQAHRSAIAEVHEKADLIILSLRNLYYIDLDGAEALAEIIDDITHRKKRIAISSVNEITAPILNKTHWYQSLKRKGLVFNSTAEALHALKP